MQQGNPAQAEFRRLGGITKRGITMLNRIILIGRLTKDPELRYTPNGIAVAQFTLAVDRPFKNQEGERETDFINIVVWRKQGENCAEYLAKGRLAAVDGRLQIRTYDKDGKRQYYTEVVADSVRFLDHGEKSEAKQPADESNGDTSSENVGSDADVNPDDIPF